MVIHCSCNGGHPTTPTKPRHDDLLVSDHLSQAIRSGSSINLICLIVERNAEGRSLSEGWAQDRCQVLPRPCQGQWGIPIYISPGKAPGVSESRSKGSLPIPPFRSPILFFHVQLGCRMWRGRWVNVGEGGSLGNDQGLFGGLPKNNS